MPREARLLCDDYGKLIFIGDCAPLSFFQSVRQLVTSRVGQASAFAPESSRYSVLENAASSSASWAASSAPVAGTGSLGGHGAPEVRPADVPRAVTAYLSMTTGLVDLFNRARLVEDLVLWANLDRQAVGGDDDVASVVNYLVLAIGRLLDDEELSRAYFEHARDRAYAFLSGSSLGVGTVQAFALVTVYMLCSCRLNGAFLFFGIAVRAAYSIGVHRTEVNARFGPDGRRQRDRLWKSLRVVDLSLSTSMGRPPATSDVDCTVSYRCAAVHGGGDDDGGDLLDASVQILLITECIVLEVYSRRKISLQLTEGISRQLRDWSARWLPHLKDVVAGRRHAHAVGACQVLASYYYAVMLVSRPFLMYELCRRLSDAGSTPRRAAPTSGRSKLADACIEAASLMVDAMLDLIDKGLLNVRVPLMVYVSLPLASLYSLTYFNSMPWLASPRRVPPTAVLTSHAQLMALCLVPRARRRSSRRIRPHLGKVQSHVHPGPRPLLQDGWPRDAVLAHRPVSPCDGPRVPGATGSRGAAAADRELEPALWPDATRVARCHMLRGRNPCPV